MQERHTLLEEHIQPGIHHDRYGTAWTTIEGETEPRKGETYMAADFAYVREHPPDHKVYSIFTSAFCFLPIGLWALYHSFQVKKRFSNGDVQESHRSSLLAYKLNHIACVVGFITWIVLLYMAITHLARG